jgi:hypothetical protein
VPDAPFCYGVNNEAPGHAQNRIGALRPALSQPGNTRQQKIEKAKKIRKPIPNSQASKLLELEGSNPPIRRGDT